MLLPGGLSLLPLLRAFLKPPEVKKYWSLPHKKHDRKGDCLAYVPYSWDILEEDFRLMRSIERNGPQAVVGILSEARRTLWLATVPQEAQIPAADQR